MLGGFAFGTHKEVAMKFGSAVLSGVIGGACSLLAMWLVFGVFDVPFVMVNMYIGVAIAGFFSAFFAIMFSGGCCPASKKDSAD